MAQRRELRALVQPEALEAFREEFSSVARFPVRFMVVEEAKAGSNQVVQVHEQSEGLLFRSGGFSDFSAGRAEPQQVRQRSAVFLVL